MQHQWVTINVDDSQMWAYISLPDGPGPHPGVIVIQHAFGLDSWIQGMCRRLSMSGYATISPDLYHRHNPDEPAGIAKMQRLKDSNICRDVDATVDLLRKHPDVLGDRIGITGFCMGGRVAYMMSGINPAIKAAAVFYGTDPSSSWGGGPTPIELTADIHCPILGLFGELDRNPTMDDVNNLENALANHEKTYKFCVYPDTGHAFMREGTDYFREGPAKDAWDQLMDWFGKYLSA